jgi:hypothetical protein
MVVVVMVWVLTVTEPADGTLGSDGIALVVATVRFMIYC